MGKYIIELERGETAYKTVNSNGKPMIQLLAPTPYIELDLELVRVEAYEKGFDAGRMLNNGKYEKGLNDAWEAARKIIHMPEADLLNLFTECYSAVCTSVQVFLKYDASECIEKIRQYEQKREEKITKGDIVRIKSAPEVEILVTYADEVYVSGIALTEVDDSCEIGDQYTDIRIHKVEKTGGHYEIAEILKKMKEETNG